MSKLEPLNFPPLPDDWENMPNEDGITFEEAKESIDKLSGVPDTFKGKSEDTMP